MEKTKREKILEAALEMFVNNGFESSPTSKIAKQAGVATGTLFHYFKTKDELINELYLEVKTGLISAMKQNLLEAKTIRKNLEYIWLNYISWSLQNSAASKFFAMFGTSSYISEATRKEGYRRFTFVLDILNQGIEAEILKNISMELMTEVTFGLLSGSINYFSNHPTEFRDEVIKERAFSIYWDAVKR